jgi:hypothetical protein
MDDIAQAPAQAVSPFRRSFLQELYLEEQILHVERDDVSAYDFSA